MNSRDTTDGVTRRNLLRTGAAGAAGLAVAGAASSPVSADMDAYNEWLAEADWDGTTADATTAEEVFVQVGAGPEGLQYNPPAILIEPGTTITFEWTGQGGNHNVVHQTDPDPERDEKVFDSMEDAHDGDIPASEGTIYELTLDEEGWYPYVCTPHASLEMKGVIVVGEDHVETDLSEYDLLADDGSNFRAIWSGAAVFGAVSLVGVAAYRELIEE